MKYLETLGNLFYCNIADFDAEEWVEALGRRIVLSNGMPYSIAQHKDNPSDCSDRTEYFDWHSDGLYHPHPPKYVLLHCLDAGSGAVVTELASSQIILGHLISEKTLYTLGKLRSCYIGHNGAYHHPILTIKGMLMASRGFVEPLPGLSLDEQPSIRDINLALTELYARLDHNVLSYDWKVGDTLIFNQYHYMHRRNSAVIDKDRKLIRMWFN